MSVSFSEPLPLATSSEKWITVGRISGLFGVRGWVKIFSHTQPRDNILSYSPWYLEIDGKWMPYELADGQAHGKGVIAHLKGIDDRDQAAAFIGKDIAIQRAQLPPAEKGEFYWIDLEGLTVVTREGRELGQVDHLMETGANDVLVVKGERERLIPYIMDQVIVQVDTQAGRIVVDWDPDF